MDGELGGLSYVVCCIDSSPRCIHLELPPGFLVGFVEVPNVPTVIPTIHGWTELKSLVGAAELAVAGHA